MPDGRLPRTKIVATLGPSCDEVATVERMIRAGLSVARLNMAHGKHADHARRIETARKAAQRAGRDIAIMGDIAGPKLRIGEIRGGKVTLENGKRVVLTGRPIEGTAQELSVSEPEMLRDVRVGEPVFLADGSLELRAIHAGPNEVECQVVNGGLLLPRKGINLPRTRLRMPALTTQDVQDLRFAVKSGFDLLALSFVRDVADLRLARRHLGRARIPLIAKIEKREATRQLPAILDEADGAMVARGDLAVETSYAEVPLLQKRIIRTANERAKPVITATQMLKSMVESPHPTRAEAGDVANAILDGTDAVMLSEETAMGSFPVKAVETMARIARHAEDALDPAVFLARAREERNVAMEVSEGAVQVARSLQAAAIVTPTGGGGTPRFVARLRPRIPVVALTRRLATARFLNLIWGVEPVHTPKLGDLEATLAFGLGYLKRNHRVRAGNNVVFTAGFPADGQASNLMTVQRVP